MTIFCLFCFYHFSGLEVLFMVSICWIISVLVGSLSDTWCSSCWIFICVWQVCTTLQCWTWRDAILLMHVWNLFQVCFLFGLVLANDPYNSIHYYYYYYYEKASGYYLESNMMFFGTQFVLFIVYLEIDINQNLYQNHAEKWNSWNSKR